MKTKYIHLECARLKPGIDNAMDCSRVRCRIQAAFVIFLKGKPKSGACSMHLGDVTKDILNEVEEAKRA